MTLASVTFHAAAAAIFATGLFTVIARGNLLKKLLGLLLLHVSVWIVFVAMSGTPASPDGATIANPLPIAFTLIEIVLGTTAMMVGIDLALRIRASAVSVEDDEIAAHELKS